MPNGQWLCREAGLVLGMGHERRFEPPIVDILQKASGGHLGRILQIEANFSHDKFMTLNKSNWRLDPQEAPVAGMTATGILTDLSVKLPGAAYDVRVSASDFGCRTRSCKAYQFRRNCRTVSVYASDCSMFDKCAASKIANLAPEIRLRMNSCASIGVAASSSPAMSSVGALIFESKAR